MTKTCALNGIKIEINEDFEKAFDMIENNSQNVFITGKAGTGKSTFLEYFQSITSKSIVVLAPTGVAALNIKGQTIHSFFKFKPNITIDEARIRKSQSKIYKKLDAIVIDEISMVRSDLLDCIDAFMRLNGRHASKPFGGVQMILIGDLYQLPPVVKYNERNLFHNYYKSPYFFDSKSFPDLNMQFIELKKHYRQTDNEFIQILNAIRNKTATQQHLNTINKRFNPDFNPKIADKFITLTATNNIADKINQAQLKKIESHEYKYHAKIKGNISANSYPNDENLVVKPDAQIMFLNNDSSKRWVNGTIGIIKSIEHDYEEDIINVELADNSIVSVMPYKWDMFKFLYNKESGKIESEAIGSFTQYPIMLAWAITIHKSQGKTFDKIIIDIGKGTFAPGQLYVALSRCTTIKGIILNKKFEQKHIFNNWRIVDFVTKYQYKQSEQKVSLSQKSKIIENAIQNNKKIKIVYLKANDEKSERIISPSFVGDLEYQGHIFLGLKGFDSKRKEERNFKLNRILEISIIE